MEIGAQFYTLRDHCKTLEDFAESLKKVADIGYKTVQISGTCAYDPQWLKERLDETGLRCVLTHTSPDRMREAPQQVMEDHKTFGCRYIGLGYPPNGLNNGEADFKALCDILDAAAKPMAEGGFYLMYHNHALEFMKDSNGKTYFERLVEAYAPEVLGFTLDTYWLQAGGMTPPDVIRALKGRVPCVHLKDMAVRGNNPVMAAVGSGNLNFDAIVAACADAGTEYVLVEQDDCGGEDPFVCLKRSYEFLKSRGLQ